MARRTRTLLAHEYALAELVAKRTAEHLIELLEQRGILASTGISARAGKEVETFRDREMEPASSAPTDTETAGESEWSMRRADEIMNRLKQKKRRFR